jgi:hypothetical protein
MNLSNLPLQAQVIAGGTENLNDVLGIRQLHEKGGGPKSSYRICQ